MPYYQYAIIMPYIPRDKKRRDMILSHQKTIKDIQNDSNKMIKSSPYCNHASLLKHRLNYFARDYEKIFNYRFNRK